MKYLSVLNHSRSARATCSWCSRRRLIDAPHGVVQRARDGLSLFASGFARQRRVGCCRSQAGSRRIPLFANASRRRPPPKPAPRTYARGLPDKYAGSTHRLRFFFPIAEKHVIVVTIYLGPLHMSCVQAMSPPIGTGY